MLRREVRFTAVDAVWPGPASKKRRPPAKASVGKELVSLSGKMGYVWPACRARKSRAKCSIPPEGEAVLRRDDFQANFPTEDALWQEPASRKQTPPSNASVGRKLVSPSRVKRVASLRGA